MIRARAPLGIRLQWCAFGVSAVGLFAAGCGSEGGGTAVSVAAQQDDAATALGGGGGGDADAGPSGLEDTAPPTTLGADCKADADCSNGEVCYRGVCVKTCKVASDCAGTEDCSRDAAKRLVCSPRSYNAAVGAECGADGKCAEGTKCIGTPYSADAFCTAACTDDTDCPMEFACTKGAQESVCLRRKFCHSCEHDANCGAGSKCIELEGARVCAKGCNAGSTECPRYAACQDVGGGDFRCVHKAGACVGDGSLCSPCTGDGQCGSNGACLTYNYTKESFCATPCGGGCPSGFECATSLNKCVPADKKAPSCVPPPAKMMEVGDIMDDYAMVGMADIDGDGKLDGEAPQVLSLSGFAKHYEVILLNIAAVWCSACQAETKDMRSLSKKYEPKGFIIMQTLYDGAKPGDPITLGLLKQWNKQLLPSGVVGMDPDRNCSPYNVGGSTPLNMLIDAKTRKVLYKVNGYNRNTMEQQLNKIFAAKGL